MTIAATALSVGGAAAATVAGSAVDTGSEVSSPARSIADLRSGDAIVRFALESAAERNGAGVDFNRLGLQVALDQAVNQTLMTDVAESAIGPQSAVAVNDGVSSVPIPAALPLFVSALLVLGLISHRRQRQAKAN